MKNTLLLMSFIFLAVGFLGCKSQKAGVEASEKPKPTFSLDDFKRVEGTDFLMASVYAEDDSKDRSILSKIGSESGYGEEHSSHNVVFLNLKDNSFSQLFPNNDYLISTLNMFPTKAFNGNEPKIEFFIYRIIKADTNNNQKLDREDKEVLAISDVNGGGYTELIDGIGSIYAQEMKDLNTLTVVYWKDLKKWISNIDVRNKKITYTAELPEFTKALN
jgi:hypothetical protein